MLFRSIVSAFFLDASSHDDLAAFAKRAGMAELAPLDGKSRVALGLHEPARQVLGGSWGAFRETWAILDDVGPVRCLQLYSPATRYRDAVIASRAGVEVDDDDPVMAYVRTFRDACLALRPRAAFLDTQPHYEDEAWEDKQGSRTYVLEQASLVAARDADALARRFFSLLYLDAQMSAIWTPEPPGYPRDMIEMSAGRLIFAGSGPSRMA
jgi:hypothetical protein